VSYAVADAIAAVTMDEPETRNALSDGMLDALIAAFRRAGEDDAVRVCVLASTHATTFSSGGNLAGLAADVPLVHRHAQSARFPELLRTVGTLGRPVMCATGGHCLAGALGLALACDLIVASDTATFATPEIDVGLFAFMVMALLFRNVGRKKATELLLLGDKRKPGRTGR
jgi:enoyl-CoA hydratase/carnithine racemase